MSERGQAVLGAARSRLGAPFRNHYLPEDACERGRITIDDCMQSGLDSERGYDCSGLVVASLCDVLGISPETWPREYRHVEQLHRLKASTELPQPGDMLVFDKWDCAKHVGIYAQDGEVVHASLTTDSIVEGLVRGEYNRVWAIPSETLLALGVLSAEQATI